jgi:hypothetical protein
MKNEKSALKILSLGIVLLSMVANTQNSSASTSVKPTVVSFTMSPDTVDLAQPNPLASIDLIVTSPTGILTQQTVLTLTYGGTHQNVLPLIRTDNPINKSLTTVTFHANLNAAVLPAGVYSGSAQPITTLNPDGSVGYSTDVLYPKTTSKVVGAENSLLIRSSGDLNFAYSTFNGPTFDHVNTDMSLFVNSKYKLVADPMWNVGETFNPADFYELEVPSLSLKVSSITPSICTSDGLTLKLIAEGYCSFIVSTPKTSDYQEFKDK